MSGMPRFRLPPRRGVALLVVLWLVAALSFGILAGVRSVKAHLADLGLERQRLRAHAVLQGALGVVALALRGEPAWARGYARLTVRLDGQDVLIEVVPSIGLVDPNVASDELLQALFARVGGLDDGSAKAMAVRVRDWIDPDDQPGGLGGAEAAQYRAAGWPVPPRNGRVEAIAELRDLFGMTRALYETIEKFMGTHGSAKIDLGSAPPSLVDALTGQPGLGQRLLEAAPEQREALWASLTSSGLFEVSRSGGAGIWRVTAQWSDGSGGRWRQTVWIDRNERPDTLTPWTTLMALPVQRLPETTATNDDE